ncbi:cytochrome P450 [Algiphilus sp. W345]|uniref:Cytochrome P450 n=1 Tax=Banduia mediterranea TaxID=3075609 RepID=A0ABU2WML8_9GAMM|nr:cytochrome P450 [Algiphilus sp. W345]MDT0498775.1 cytochrome P450 [Algiphilus sp. W345]
MDPVSKIQLAPNPPQRHDLDADGESLRLLQAWLPRYGNICRVSPLTRTRDALVIHHPDDIRQVLLVNRANYTKGVGLERVRMLLGNGLIVSDGALWMRQRRMMQPLFHSQVLRGFSELIRRENLALVERWAEVAARGESINLTRELSELTLAIVLRSLISSDLDRLIDAHGENPFALLTRQSRRDLAFAAQFRALVPLVRETIERRRREGRIEHDFLSMMMETRDRDTGEAMPDRALLDEIMSLIVAGHETTASTLNWTWYLLSQHPDVEAGLHRTADALAPELSASEAAKLPEVAQILEEALRLYPPVWLFSRRALRDDSIGAYAVPAGTDIFICPYLLHRDPAHWHEPEVFQPRRFAPEEATDRHRFAFLPFSAGPRHCIGEGFAMSEMAAHLILVARRLRLEYCGSTTPEPEFLINLRTRQDLQMRPVAR